MKKILALILALCMIFALAACGGAKSGKDEFSVVGTWSSSIDLAKAAGASDPDAAAMFGDDPIPVEMLLIFAEDGSVKVDAELDAAIPAIKAAMAKMIEEEYGMSVEEFESLAGTSLDSLIDADSLKQSLADEDLSGTYKVEGDKVIINNQPENSLTIKDGKLVVDADELGELVFTRK